MLKETLDSAGISKKACAGLLGVDPHVLDRWAAGQAPIPDGYARTLSAMLGVTPETLSQGSSGPRTDGDRTPPIWFRLRNDKRIVERDRDYVALVRRLAFLVDQFEQATSSPSVVWETVFHAARNINMNAPPREQGRRAAQIFRGARGLGQGATGIGNVLRGNLRALGVLVVETPLPKSQVEGCSFYVQSPDDTTRPSIFANTHSNTWFRRNYVLLHEVCHLIFDAMPEGASVDFADSDRPLDVAEQRADAFAQEMLVPASVIRHVAQSKGTDWANLTPRDVAVLVAETQVEQRVVLAAALDASLLTADAAERAMAFDIASDLEGLTERAWSAFKYFDRYPEAKQWHQKRMTTIPSVPLLLPMSYVKPVLDAVTRGEIAWSKGAELLMVDRQTFLSRFGDLLPADDDE